MTLGLGQCSNGVIVSLGACSATLSCQVLPLVNKPGTSVACTTEQDKVARIKANGGVSSGTVGSTASTGDASGTCVVENGNDSVDIAANGKQTNAGANSTNANAVTGKQANAGANSSAASNANAATANKAGDFVCIDDTTFKHFTSATQFVEENCPPGFCFTRSPPFKNPCVGKANARRIDGAGNTA